MAAPEWQVRHPDARVARLAAAQRGAIHRDQLLVVGIGAGAIKHRVATGRLHPLHRSVFAVGRADLEPLGRETAALLACGRGAVLTGASAASVWSLCGTAEGPVHVNLPSGAGRNRDGIVVHRETIDTSEVRVEEHLRVTSPARTLVSLADAVDLTELELMVGSATRQRLVTERELRAAVESHRGHRGIGRLRQILERGPRFTRSEAERRFLAIVRASGLPQPEVNAWIARHEVDFVWRTARLVVEVDG